MTIKSTKLALALFGALSLTGAVGATPAEAAPQRGGMMQSGFHNDMGHADAFHDQRHRPQARFEAHMRAPQRGFHWHGGQWQWQHNQWQWSAGFWNAR